MRTVAAATTAIIRITQASAMVITVVMGIADITDMVVVAMVTATAAIVAVTDMAAAVT
jgi:hypothetical protein